MPDIYRSIFAGMSAEQIERLLNMVTVYRFAKSVPTSTLLTIARGMQAR